MEYLAAVILIGGGIVVISILASVRIKKWQGPGCPNCSAAWATARESDKVRLVAEEELVTAREIYTLELARKDAVVRELRGGLI